MKVLAKILGVMVLAGSLGGESQAAIVVQGEPAPPETNAPNAVPAPNNPDKQHPDVLRFLNGDVLHGEFISMDAKSGAKWQHPAIKEPMNIALSSIAQIKLGERAGGDPKPNGGQACKVRLTNGDLLCGELAGMDDSVLQLNTWYGGTLKIPRKSIDTIVPGQAKAALVYEGPTGLEGWTRRGAAMMVGPGGVINRGGEAWSFRDGSFVSSSSGSIGRSFDFPPMANIEFDLGWTGYLQLSISLLSDSVETYGGNCYLLMLSQGNVYLQRTSRAGDSAMLGTTEAAALARKNQAHISLRVNREQKSIALLVDGGLVKQWTDPAAFMNGQNLVFNQQGQFGTKLSNLKISPWDGKLEENTGVEKKTQEDLVRLSNKDKISGTLKNIQNGKMTFQTAFAALEVPMDRVSEIELAGQKPERTALQPGEMRLAFAEGGSVTVQVEHWDAQQIKASSPSLGQVSLKPGAFAEVVMNPEQKKTDQGESGMGGPGDDIIIDKN